MSPSPILGQEPRYSPLFVCLAWTGLRFGEAAGLQWADLDLRAGELHVQRTLSKGRIGTPKSGQARRVDLSRELATVLQRLQVERKAETLRRGWPEVPPWVFVSAEGHPLSEPLARAAFLKALKAAIRVTVDVYGRWLPTGDKSAVDRLDAPQMAKATEIYRACVHATHDP